MSRHLGRDLIAQHAQVRAELLQPVTVDRTFELPKALYVVTGALYLGFLAVMAVGLSSPGLAIPLTICAVFIAMFFAVPALWVRMKASSAVPGMAWDTFCRRGVATHTGRLGAGEAAAQMLVLPVLVFVWGLVCVAIVALV